MVDRRENEHLAALIDHEVLRIVIEALDAIILLAGSKALDGADASLLSARAHDIAQLFLPLGALLEAPGARPPLSDESRSLLQRLCERVSDAHGLADSRVDGVVSSVQELLTIYEKETLPPPRALIAHLSSLDLAIRGEFREELAEIDRRAWDAIRT